MKKVRQLTFGRLFWGAALIVLASPVAGQTVPFLVKDLSPTSLSSNPTSFTNVNGTLFFSADDRTHGAELWKSDGSAAGTALVKDIGPYSSNPEGLTDVNGTLLFVANDGLTGC